MNSIKLSSYYEVYYVALSNFRLLLVRGIARKCAFFSYWIETVILLLSKHRLLQELSVYFHLLLCLITINRLKHQRAFQFYWWLISLKMLIKLITCSGSLNCITRRLMYHLVVVKLTTAPAEDIIRLYRWQIFTLRHSISSSI